MKKKKRDRKKGIELFNPEYTVIYDEALCLMSKRNAFLLVSKLEALGDFYHVWLNSVRTQNGNGLSKIFVKRGIV